MELQVVNTINNKEAIETPPNRKHNPFIEANTTEVSLSHLKRECTIPVFAKDNEVTISHQEFIDSMQYSISGVFSNHRSSSPEIRVSHMIKGRIPEAIRKPVNELLPNEKTIYYERCAFIIEIPSIINTVGGNTLSLVAGGVRAYNQENLYSKKTIEKFKVFVGFINQICTNLCISTDGFSQELRVSSILELQEKMILLLSSYNMLKHIEQMKSLQEQFLTERQFAQILGKARLYSHLPNKLKQSLPQLNFNDGQLNAVARDYYEDKSFCRDDKGNINLWNVYNLFTSANKSSYIDSYLDRNVNAFEFSNGLATALNGDSNYHWFLG